MAVGITNNSSCCLRGELFVQVVACMPVLCMLTMQAACDHNQFSGYYWSWRSNLYEKYKQFYVAMYGACIVVSNEFL